MSGNVYHETSGDNEIIVNWNKAMAWIEHTHTHRNKTQMRNLKIGNPISWTNMNLDMGGVISTQNGNENW